MVRQKCSGIRRSYLGENVDLIAQWGEGSDKQCKASYVLKPTDVKNNIAVVSTVCR